MHNMIKKQIIIENKSYYSYFSYVSVLEWDKTYKQIFGTHETYVSYFVLHLLKVDWSIAGMGLCKTPTKFYTL